LKYQQLCWAISDNRDRQQPADYVPGKPCVYVGMTGLDPDLRFDKHKAGVRINKTLHEKTNAALLRRFFVGLWEADRVSHRILTWLATSSD